MNLKYESIRVEGYEDVVKFSDEESGLLAIIAIHNTTFGPGVGGIRIYPYPSFEMALKDVLGLAKSMTYKATITNLNVGGAKSVIIADPSKDKTPELLESFAAAVNMMKGRYICATDVGCTCDDMEIILESTKYGCGSSNITSSGNPAPFTAWGVYKGIESVLQKSYGNSNVKDRVFVIQGLGKVGFSISQQLFWRGGRLIVSDVDENLSKLCSRNFGAKVVDPNKAIFTECDVLVPSAMGGIINKMSIPNLKCRAIAGPANNQLNSYSDAALLNDRDILYAPDFVINAGGLINVVQEILGTDGYLATRSRDHINFIYDQLMEIYEISDKNNISTHEAAINLVDFRLKAFASKV